MKEWLVYEVILLNKILRNHFLSENIQLNYASFNGLPLIVSCTRSWNLAWHLLWRSTTESKNIVKLLAMSQISHTVCCEDDYFPKGNLNYLIVCFTQCTLFCSKKFVFYCRFVRRALSVGRMQRREMFCCDKARGRHWRRLACWFGLFTIVYVSKYCVPITTLNPNKRIWVTPK